MPERPTGTVTFLFSDIEGSTRLLHEVGDRYTDVLADYRHLRRTALEAVGGHEIDTAGDGFFAAFHRATDAVTAAAAAQRAIMAHPWPARAQVRVCSMRTKLGETAYEELWAAGREMTLEEALALTET